MNTISATIAQELLGWTLVNPATGLGLRPGVSDGGLEHFPDFLLPSGNRELRAAMLSRGFALTVTQNQLEPRSNKISRAYRATFTRGNEAFGETQANENLAVCLAALKASHIQITLSK